VRNDGIDAGRQRARVLDVGLDGQRLATPGLDLIAGGLELGRGAAHNADPRPLLRKGKGDALTDPDSCTNALLSGLGTAKEGTSL
jgi:hypothetical protein